MSSPSPAERAPLIVGVSGHRDLKPDCVDGVKMRVAQFIAQLRKLAPDTEIRLIVGMAAGADFLVAQVALEQQLPVDAVLPMPLESYAKDFSPAGLTRLKELLSHSQVRTIELDPPGHLGQPVDMNDRQIRDSLYVNLSNFLIRKSNILIALWNGESTPLPGGTADTVLRYLRARPGVAEAAVPVSFVEDTELPAWGHQFVYWVPTSRHKGDPAPESSAPSFLSAIGENLLRLQTRIPNELQQQLEQLNEYNAEYGRLLSAADGPPRDTLLKSVPDGLSERELETLRTIDLEYGKADALAVYCQRHSDRLFKWFSIMASAMGFFFLVYAKLVASKVFLLAYLSLLLLGLGVFYSFRSRNWFAKHLVYRVLAETMRVKFFLRLAAADQHVNAEQLIALTGIDKFAGFSWIITILKHVEPFNTRPKTDPVLAARNLEAVKGEWIEGQLRYFGAKVKRMGSMHHRLERLKTRLFYALVLITVVLLLFGNSLQTFVVQASGTSLKDVLMFLMGLLPVWLGIWELYQGKMATRELLWQYQNQLNHYSRAMLQLAQSSDPARETRVLADLGRESLMEGYLWTIHRFHREHEPPSAS